MKAGWNQLLYPNHLEWCSVVHHMFWRFSGADYCFRILKMCYVFWGGWNCPRKNREDLVLVVVSQMYDNIWQCMTCSCILFRMWMHMKVTRCCDLSECIYVRNRHSTSLVGGFSMFPWPFEMFSQMIDPDVSSVRFIQRLFSNIPKSWNIMNHCIYLYINLFVRFISIYSNVTWDGC